MWLFEARRRTEAERSIHDDPSRVLGHCHACVVAGNKCIFARHRDAIAAALPASVMSPALAKNYVFPMQREALEHHMAAHPTQRFIFKSCLGKKGSGISVARHGDPLPETEAQPRAGGSMGGW